MYLSDCSHLPYVSLVLSFLFWPQSHLLKEVKWRKGGCWLRPGFNLLGLSLAPPTSTPPPLPVLGSAGVKRNTDLSVSNLLHLQSVFCNRLDHKLGSIFPNSGVERPGYIKACVLRINPLWSKKKKEDFLCPRGLRVQYRVTVCNQNNRRKSETGLHVHQFSGKLCKIPS